MNIEAATAALDAAENGAKRGWVIECRHSAAVGGGTFLLGNTAPRVQPWIYADKAKADKADCVRNGDARVRPCLYFPVVMLDDDEPNPTDPGDPCRQRIAEESAAGRGR